MTELQTQKPNIHFGKAWKIKHDCLIILCKRLSCDSIPNLVDWCLAPIGNSRAWKRKVQYVQVYQLIPNLASPKTAIMSTEPVANRHLPLLPVKNNFLKRVNLSQLLQRVIPAGRDRAEQATEVQCSRLPSPLHQP